MENRKARVVMLALSGLLFGISGLGWCLHNGGQQSANEPVPVSNSEYAASTIPESEEPIISANVPPVYPATSYEEAARAARASVAPDATAFKQPVQVQAPTSSPRRLSTKVPPPPNMAKFGFIEPPKAVPPAASQLVVTPPPDMTPKQDGLTVNDVRLVGVIDGRGIFKVRRDVAHELGIAQAFTLGKGESFDNIRVVNVDAEEATVRDGRTVATKPLSRIH